MKTETLARPLSRIWSRALDLVFPPRCVSCAAFGAFVCTQCRGQMRLAVPPRCSVCWMPSESQTCDRCRYQRPAFSALRTAFVYEGPARDAVHALKFDGVSAVTPTMATPMLEVLLHWAPPVDFVVPVPLPPARRRARGYNQSELLARTVAQAAGLRVETRLLARRETTPQARQTDDEARRANVREAFRPARKSVSGAVLLVDDVATTGATLDACAAVLKGMGAAGVYALTYARED